MQNRGKGRGGGGWGGGGGRGRGGVRLPTQARQEKKCEGVSYSGNRRKV